MFDLLPVELIVLIISLLPTSRDKIRLRCASRRFRSVCEIPSLWHDFKWPCYEDRDCEIFCVQSALKSCGEHVKVLSFPDHVPPSRLMKFFDYCRNVTQLNIPTTKLDLGQVRSVLDSMKHLQKLNTKWNCEVWQLLKVTFNSNLKELTVRIKMHVRSDGKFYNVDSAGLFLTPTYLWVEEWMSKGFVPQNINFITLSLRRAFSLLASEMFRVWLMLNGNSPTGHNGYLTFYSSKPHYLTPHLPEFQIEFGQTAVLPIVKTSDFGALGLDRDWLFLTRCSNSHKTVYKAACMRPCEEKRLKFVSSLPNFNCVIEFDLACWVI